MNNIIMYVLLFFFYSAAGWLVESTYCSIGEKRIINRGFLTGPMCPIYGSGALVMTVFLYNPFRDKPLYVFLIGMVLCDLVEYITSLLMETLFHARWWDYTSEFINIKGRICLKHTLYWGIASVAFVYVIHPKVNALFALLNPNVMLYIMIAVLVIFAADVINAVRKALDIRQLQIKLNKIIDTVTESLNNVKNSIETMTQGRDKSEKSSDEQPSALEQIQDVIQQFELRFSRKTKKQKNKYASRFFHNSMPIEKNTRKQIERLKKLVDDIKSNVFENGEMQ
ncbi:MAG: hypothetical protein NC122_00670 [Faecalibacterium sp.]|nr:hypothetical protein [Ruminococcus sp.]MCM1484701.1 hypothetical protein [Faecalibacterium sp.]